MTKLLMCILDSDPGPGRALLQNMKSDGTLAERVERIALEIQECKIAERSYAISKHLHFPTSRCACYEISGSFTLLTTTTSIQRRGFVVALITTTVRAREP